ncbi:hypothetical protein [Ponticaulis sp.]|uniref:hypothetical protein n=1 Tax=Ponticaulis sp. TaxID=2020902 RepID=UPI000B75E13D|nr:hypothetical protein [Ponticaulis sp.]MAI91908.1 hypothetical protein [Ponticaulis sp.]OUX96585.1 MAG: hypothetical protein CBB65_15870 [Hyphomonadaceae bacterium TMED5]|tara:strand:- start:24818 stop:25024 length:207 start_codon:yes stop_codon:yes gene_type:complete
MPSSNPSPRTDEWLQDQMRALESWIEELRVADPAGYRARLENIEAHRSWLRDQIAQLSQLNSNPYSPF